MIAGRITWSEPDGSWGIDGVDLSTLTTRLYMAVFKLKKYEDSGRSPDQLEDLIFDMENKERG